MTVPVHEPNQGSKNAGFGWNQHQLYRRSIPPGTTPPAPIGGIFPRAPVGANIFSINDALPASTTNWTIYPFDTTWFDSPPVGTAKGSGTPSQSDQYFAYVSNDIDIGLPLGGTVYVEAQLLAASYPNFSPQTWDSALMGLVDDALSDYDPDAPYTYGSMTGTSPDNIAIYDGTALVAANVARWTALIDTRFEERQWLTFYYRHNGPETEDDRSGLIVQMAYWPSGYSYALPSIADSPVGLGVMFVTPESVDTDGSLSVMLRRDEKNANVNDWIAIAEIGSNAFDYDPSTWIYTSSGTQTPGGTALFDGMLTMVAPSTPGEYELRWYMDDTFDVIANSTFTVVVS